jgi:glutathione S-transferase
MGLPYEVRLVSFPPADSYRALHSLGTVPFLEDEGGVAMCESVAIMLYLAQRHGPTPLLPAGNDPRLARVLQLAEFGEATIGAGLNSLVAVRFLAPQDEKRNWSVRWQEERSAAAVRYVSQSLGESSFLAAEQLTLADLSVIPALSLWSSVLGHALPENLARYVERTGARPAYQRAQLRARGDSSAPAA